MNIDLSSYPPLDNMTDDHLLVLYHESLKEFTLLVNQGKDEEADKIDTFSLTLEEELLNRQHIELNQIYQK